MKIRIIGDIHGDYIAYDKIAEDVTHSIQVGDFGKGFGPSPEHMSLTHRFIRGNHDDPAACKEDPHWIPDGTTETVNGVKFMFIGGAWSIDKDFRTPGKDWWPDEEISLQDMYSYASVYKEFKPEIMITHDLPFSVSCRLFPKPQNIRTNTGMYLEHLFEIHKPKLWIAGHWHENKQENIEGTRFCVLGINSYTDLNAGDVNDKS